MKNVYDVALWRYWHATDLHASEPFPVVGLIVAESPLLAALALMEKARCKHVAHVRVGWQGCRYEETWSNNNKPLALYTEEQSVPRYEEVNR